MIDGQRPAPTLKRFGGFAAAAAAFLALSTGAPAQSFLGLFGAGPSPYEVERRLDADGYVLTGPLLFRGGVYLADVEAQRGEFERLVIDAETGRILERFRARRAPDWRPGEADVWGAPPPPPVELAFPGDRGPPPASDRDQLASGDELGWTGAVSSLGGARPVSTDLIEKPKPKPKSRAAKRDVATPPAANAAYEPPDATSRTAPPPAAPAASPTPSQLAKTEGPRSAAAAPTPAAAPEAPPPAKKKAVNDLPVTPLD